MLGRHRYICSRPGSPAFLLFWARHVPATAHPHLYLQTCPLQTALVQCQVCPDAAFLEGVGRCNRHGEGAAAYAQAWSVSETSTAATPSDHRGPIIRI